METTQKAYFVDPGERYGLDIETASMFIARAAEWPEGSRERAIERNGLGWRILRAYLQMSPVDLGASTGETRYGTLLGVRPGLLFRTPRPVWAVSSFSEGYTDGETCTHELPFFDQAGVELKMKQVDTADESGAVTFGAPSVVMDVGGEETRLRSSDLMKLRQAVENAAVHDGRYGK